MKRLLLLLEDQDIPLNQCYKNYEVCDDTLLIKKSNESYSSSIETRELVTLYEVFEKENNIKINILKNGDICVKKVFSPRYS